MLPTTPTAKDYRQQATELRLAAERMSDPARAQCMCDVANSYDRLAKTVEKVDP